LRALGEDERARSLQEGALVGYRRVLGDDHPETLRAAGNLDPFAAGRTPTESVDEIPDEAT
jgi:hypothetical protein